MAHTVHSAFCVIIRLQDCDVQVIAAPPNGFALAPAAARETAANLAATCTRKADAHYDEHGSCTGFKRGEYLRESLEAIGWEVLHVEDRNVGTMD